MVFGADEPAVLDMLVRHFSLHGDTVLLVNVAAAGKERFGRKVKYETFNPQSAPGSHEVFRNSAYFKRFVVDREAQRHGRLQPCASQFPDARVYQGDCFEILSALPDASVGGAVTSPPYYNARSYTVWPNIYCYLYDMYNAARQVFRVLKPGSLYLFNIFDYFDNENNIVFSAMGKKRMILGAYIVDLFRRVGFEVSGNVVWYKGEIEGKRNFNQGNKSPYYQFPFNCWEHTLIFRKPGVQYPMSPTFRSLKSLDLLIRPIRDRTEDRVPAHIFFCLLAYYVEWHLRRAWAPLLFADEELPNQRSRRDPVLPAPSSESAQAKKLTHQTADGLPVQSLATLLADLASRSRVTYSLKTDKSGPTFQQVPPPTPLQAKAYELLNLLPVVGN